MNKNTGIVLALIVLVAVGGFIIFGKKAPVAPSSDVLPTYTSEPTTTTNTNVDTSTTIPTPQTVTIVYTNAGFSPSTVDINKGDTVVFKNMSSQNMWVASNPHPTHTDFSAFDAKKGYAPGTSYSFTFTDSGTYGFHDHLHSVLQGSVVVIAGDK